MGAENLVEQENELFNKHITLAQLDNGRRQLQELADKHPEAFEYDPTWGYITCSPWTTLEMLELGISRAIERRFEPLGVWLYTPLLLYRHSPTSRLAERHGLVTSGWDDVAMLYEASVNGVPFDTFVPWRFQDERTGIAFALIGRFCAAALRDKYPDTIFQDDEQYERMLARETEKGPFDRPDLFAIEVIDAVKRAVRPYDRQQLLDGALAAYREVRAEVRDSKEKQARKTVAAGEQESERSAAQRQAELRALRYERVLRVVRKWLDGTLGGLEIVDVQAPPAGDAVVVLRVQLGDNRYELHLGDAAANAPYFFCSRHFSVCYMQQTPLTSKTDIRHIRRFIEALDIAVTRHAPYLLPRVSPLRR